MSSSELSTRSPTVEPGETLASDYTKIEHKRFAISRRINKMCCPIMSSKRTPAQKKHDLYPLQDTRLHFNRCWT